MSSETLNFEQMPSTDPDLHIYKLRGPLVLGNMFEFQSMLRANNASAILDLTEVPYLDSAGIGLIVNSYIARQKAGRKLLLAGANDRVSTLIKVTRLENVFEVFPTVEAATRAISRNVA
ncbi:MAG TPA: STAS domain-containing protein [Candidatus Acidoferrales bacterium]|nr:STAS domain-containing protein [Candidatus Acidoferrales bacterium]